ncbi:5656_t:CDS:2, partial [Dentiscutata heterogama]
AEVDDMAIERIYEKTERPGIVIDFVNLYTTEKVIIKISKLTPERMIPVLEHESKTKERVIVLE